jgi:hypothetical protein
VPPDSQCKSRSDCFPSRRARFFRFGRARTIRVCIAIGLALYLTYHVAGFQPRRFWYLEPKVDTWIEDNQARDIFANGVYPEQVNSGDFSAAFPYPPPVVVMFRARESSAGGF